METEETVLRAEEEQVRNRTEAKCTEKGIMWEDRSFQIIVLKLRTILREKNSASPIKQPQSITTFNYISYVYVLFAAVDEYDHSYSAVSPNSDIWNIFILPESPWESYMIFHNIAFFYC